MWWTLVSIAGVVFALSGKISASPLVTANVTVPVAGPTVESNCSEWLHWMPRRVEPAVILQVVSSDYIPVEKNFVHILERLSPIFSRQNIYLVSLDAASAEMAQSMGMIAAPFQGMGERRSLTLIWKMRVRVIACLVEAGFHVIVSDSDALWLGDPWEDFNKSTVRNSSIVASRGESPRNLYHKWGWTMCMGFIFFRPTGAGMKLFLEVFERLVIRTGDDQKALNAAANELGVVWNSDSDMRYVASTEFGTGNVENIDNFQITMLPHSRYARRCNSLPVSNLTIVAHCLAPKKGKSKKNWMVKSNLWENENYDD